MTKQNKEKRGVSPSKALISAIHPSASFEADGRCVEVKNAPRVFFFFILYYVAHYTLNGC